MSAWDAQLCCGVLALVHTLLDSGTTMFLSSCANCWRVIAQEVAKQAKRVQSSTGPSPGKGKKTQEPKTTRAEVPKSRCHLSFESFAEFSTPVPAFCSFPTAPEVDLRFPLVMSNDRELAFACKAGHVLRNKVEAFKNVFVTSSLRSSKGRASQKISEDALAMKCTSVLEGVFPAKGGTFLMRDIGEPATALLRPSVFGIAGELEYDTFMNPCLVASCRVALQGTRTCVLLNLADVRDFASKCGWLKGMPATCDNLMSVMQTNLPDELKRFTETYTVYMVTVGPGDLLYTPMGWATIERYQSKMDVYGLRKLQVVDAGRTRGRP